MNCISIYSVFWWKRELCLFFGSGHALQCSCHKFYYFCTQLFESRISINFTFTLSTFWWKFLLLIFVFQDCLNVTFCRITALKSSWEKRNKLLGKICNLGLVLIGFRTTGPWTLFAIIQIFLVTFSYQLTLNCHLIHEDEVELLAMIRSQCFVIYIMSFKTMIFISVSIVRCHVICSIWKLHMPFEN